MKHVELFEAERASMYDDYIQQWIVNYQFVINTLPKLIEVTCPKVQEILVVGCGTGNELVSLSNHNPLWNITGIDPSPDMVKKAFEKSKKLTNVKLVQTEIGHFDTEKIYDAVTLCFVLHFMKDDGTKESLLKEISDKMISGGIFILLDIFGTHAEFELNLSLLEKLLPPTMYGMLTKDRIATMPERIHPVSEERLKELLVNAGLAEPVRFFQSAIYGGWIIKKI